MTEQLLSAPFLFVLLVLVTIMAVFFVYKYQSLKAQIHERAQRLFDQWQTTELDKVKQQSLEIARREMRVEFENWKRECEQEIRQDAIQKSQAVTRGKVTEQLIPYLPGFTYNPKDARFIGSPVDFVVFDGLGEGNVRQVVFIEVKTGKSRLSGTQSQIMKVINDKRVTWVELRRDTAFETSAEEDNE